MIIALMLLVTMQVQDAEEVKAPPPRFTVAEWRKLSDYDQSISIIGGVEALLLSASGPQGEETGIDQACLAAMNLPDVKAKLHDENVIEESLFVYEMMEASGCNR